MTFEAFAPVFANVLARMADREHERAYRAYKLHDCDDNLYDEVEKWSRLSDLADECEVETGDILLARGAWRP